MAYTTINKPSATAFNTKLYTGDGSSSRNITGVNFQPDWTWVKSRNSADYNNMVTDVVRGAPKILKTDSTATEDASPGAGGIGSFDSDGFTIATGSINNTNMNNNGTTYVGWNWKANGAGSANTAGSINSTVSANTTSGFSIVKYSGIATNATVGHGLGVAPKMIIVKNLGASESWFVYHADLTSAAYTINLNTTGAQFSNASTWNSTAPSNSVFSIGTDTGTNGDGHNIIAYCFAEKTGYSKFGSYVGNGSATEGTFFYTGFKPAMIIIKKTDNGQWTIFDNKRNPSNAVRAMLVPNGSDVELSQNENNMDFLSNGVKMYNADGVFNASGGTYIYAAFAEAPLVGTNNVPCTAR